MAKLGFKLFVGTQSPHFLLHLPVHRPYNMESQSSPSFAWDQIDLNKAASCGSNLNVTFSARTRQLNSLGLYLTFEIIRSSEDGPGKLSCKSRMTDRRQHWELDSATVLMVAWTLRDRLRQGSHACPSDTHRWKKD